MPVPVSFGAVVNDSQEMATSGNPPGRPRTLVRLSRSQSGNPPREFVMISASGKPGGGIQSPEVDLGGLRLDLNVVYPPEEQESPLSLPPTTFSAHSLDKDDSPYYADGHNEIGGENFTYFASETRSMRRSRLVNMPKIEDFGGVLRKDSFDSVDLGAQALGKESKE